MSQDLYEILYFPAWGRVDVTKMILEISGAQYKHVSVGFEVRKAATFTNGLHFTSFATLQDWPSVKPSQKFGHVPRLSIKGADDNVKVRSSNCRTLIHIILKFVFSTSGRVRPSRNTSLRGSGFSHLLHSNGPKL
jgi:hypothetical protein